MSVSATVVITTKNRREELCQSIASALSQTAPLKVLVIDDGSMDGTFDRVRSEFPGVQVHRSETSRGLIVQRNRAARLAQTDIIVSIDDDAVFSTPEVMASTLREFGHPRVGAVALPVVDCNRSPQPHHQAPDRNGNFAIYDFVGTAHALKRDIFLRLGGYREILTHQGEEEDYCIRLLNAGYLTKAARVDPIHHFESPKRSFARMDYYGARNKVLYAWHNVPLPCLPVHLAVTTLKTSTFSMKPARLMTRLCGVLGAYSLILSGRASREPVGVNAYKISRDLKQRGPLPFLEIEGSLPSVHNHALPIPNATI